MKKGRPDNESVIQPFKDCRPPPFSLKDAISTCLVKPAVHRGQSVFRVEENRTESNTDTLMILPQVHLRKPSHYSK